MYFGLGGRGLGISSTNDLLTLSKNSARVKSYLAVDNSLFLGATDDYDTIDEFLDNSNGTYQGRPGIFFRDTHSYDSSQPNRMWHIGVGRLDTTTDPNFHFSYTRKNQVGTGSKFSTTSEHAIAHIIHDGSNGRMNFTGQHRCVPLNPLLYNNISNYIGMIVYSTGTYNIYDSTNYMAINDVNAITINDSLPVVDLTTTKQTKSIFGVICNIQENHYQVGCFASTIETLNDFNRILVNSVGEGGIWIVNTNGNLENGDYIQSSNITGYGEKQDDDILHSYTVAKITCDCDFNLNSTIYNCVSFVDSVSGNTYKKAFVGCTYHCG